MTRTGNKARATTPSTKSPPNVSPPPQKKPPRLKPQPSPTPILVSPLSTTSPDKGPTPKRPASPGSLNTHQRTGQRRKAQANKTTPGYGTQHAAPWVAHLRAFTQPERHLPPHTPPHQTDANKEQPATTPRRHPTRRPPTRQAKPDGPDPEENHHQQPDTHNSQGYNKAAHQVPLTW